MTTLAFICFAVWLAAVIIHLYATWLTHHHFQQLTSKTDSSHDTIPISILKPLKGVEDGAEECIESFFNLSYPTYEIIFSVAQKRDPICPLVEKLTRKYPHVQTRLIIGDKDIGHNPKINNLVISYEKASHDWILISDSNARVTPDYLSKMITHVKPGVGLVSAIISGQHAKGFWARLEAVYMNTFYARGVFLARSIGKPCVMGKSMLFQRSTANRFGGLKNLAPFLAEDYMAGMAMTFLGLKVAFMTEPVVQFLGRYSFKTFWMRHLRWGRLRKKHAPGGFLIEPFGSLAVSALMGTFSTATLFQIHPVHFLVAHLSLWVLSDLMVERQTNPTMKWHALFLWFIREIVALPLWFHIAVGNSIHWRGHDFMIQPGGTLIPKLEPKMEKALAPSYIKART